MKNILIKYNAFLAGLLINVIYWAIITENNLTFDLLSYTYLSIFIGSLFIYYLGMFYQDIKTRNKK